MITIQELLFSRGLEQNAHTKIVRHKNSRTDLYAMYRYDNKQFLEYQKTQKNDVFNNVDYIVSFIGEDSGLALFVGVFKVGTKTEKDGFFLYDLSDVKGFDDLKNRIVIRWQNPISWHQWLSKPIEVVEVRQKLCTNAFGLNCN